MKPLGADEIKRADADEGFATRPVNAGGTSGDKKQQTESAHRHFEPKTLLDRSRYQGEMIDPLVQYKGNGAS